MVDQPGAIEMYIPDNLMFTSTDATWLCIHKTAGFNTPEECARYFQSGSNGEGVSSHYIVGLDGTIVQCVPEARGSGANCCTVGSYASYLPYCDGRSNNMNWHSISVEHVDPTNDNSTLMPGAQKAASFRLIHDICVRHNIPMRSGDASGGIIGHRDIDPVNRARCPGNYPWDELWSYLANGGEHVGIPNGWQYDTAKKELTAPNGFKVVLGFCDHVLNNPWDPGNVPLENEAGVNPLEISNPGLGGGTRQRFRKTTLEYTAKMGVFESWTGQELIALEQKVAQLNQQLQAAQNGAELKALTDKLAQANQQASQLVTISTQLVNETK